MYPEPVGLEGLLRIIHFVFGVIARSKSSGWRIKFLSKGHSTILGVPSASKTISG